MAKYIDNTNLGYLISKIKAAFWPKADVTNVTLADVAVTGDYDDLINKPSPGTPKATTIPSGGMLPNVYYAVGTLTGTVTIAFASPTDANIENEYKLTFDTGSTAPNITWPNSITAWSGNCLGNNVPPSPDLKASKHYEVSVIDGIAVIAEV